MNCTPSAWPPLPLASRCLVSGSPLHSSNYLCSLSLTSFLQITSKIAQCFLSLTDTQTRNYLCSLSLTRIHQNAPRIAQCFLSLTDTQIRNYLCSLSLTRKGGWGVPRSFQQNLTFRRLSMTRRRFPNAPSATRATCGQCRAGELDPTGCGRRRDTRKIASRRRCLSARDRASRTA